MVGGLRTINGKINNQNFCCYASIYVEGLERIIKILQKDRCFFFRHLNWSLLDTMHGYNWKTRQTRAARS